MSSQCLWWLPIRGYGISESSPIVNVELQGEWPPSHNCTRLQALIPTRGSAITQFDINTLYKDMWTGLRWQYGYLISNSLYMDNLDHLIRPLHADVNKVSILIAFHIWFALRSNMVKYLENIFINMYIK